MTEEEEKASWECLFKSMGIARPFTCPGILEASRSIICDKDVMRRNKERCEREKENCTNELKAEKKEG